MNTIHIEKSMEKFIDFPSGYKDNRRAGDIQTVRDHTSTILKGKETIREVNGHILERAGSTITAAA